MRILALNWRDIRSPEAGGSEIHLHHLLKLLVKWGHDVTLVCGQFAHERGKPEETVDGIRTHRVGAWWNAHITVPRHAKHLLDVESFDLVIDDVNKIPFFAPRWSTVPVVAIFHHLLGKTVFFETNPLFASMIWMWERRVGRVYRDTPVLTVSRSTAEELESLGLSRDRMSIVPPGVDLAVHRPGLSPKAPYPLLLVVSRLKRYKRVDTAIRALARVRQVIPEARLAVVGFGDDRPRLERLAEYLDQPVEFLGAVTNAQKARLLNRAHVVLNPSAKEGWGMVGTEAMACGTPVVASDVPGHRDSIPEGAGLRVPIGDIDGFARATIETLSNQTLRGEFIRRGSRFVSRLGWETVTAQSATEIANLQGAPLAPKSSPAIAAAGPVLASAAHAQEGESS